MPLSFIISRSFGRAFSSAARTSGWAAVKLTQFLGAKTTQVNSNGAQTLAWSLINKVWLKAQAVGGKLIAKEKVLLEKILSDGVVTPEEFNTFKSAISTDLRDIAAEELPILGSLIGGQGAVSTLLEGFASKIAHQIITGQVGGAPSPSPIAGAVKPTIAAVPSPQ